MQKGKGGEDKRREAKVEENQKRAMENRQRT
jgi:hypothetical protein